MGIRVSVTLPNGVTVSVEGDPEVPRATLEYVLVELVQRLLAALGQAPAPPPAAPVPEAAPAPEAAPPTPPPAAAVPAPPEAAPEGELPSAEEEEAAAAAGRLVIPGPVRDWLIAYCRDHDPGGAMRRVVVAAEGAHRFLAQDAVSAAELRQLFEHLGWPVPSDFNQTIRNAARHTFGWLQRVPGREGYYFVTDKGRRDVLGEAPERR